MLLPLKAKTTVTTNGSDAILARLLDLHPKLVDLSLGRVERLLASLGNPEQKMPPVMHVTGTNGKGSTLAFLRAILEAAGYRVHAYASPHLVYFHERIRLAGNLITEVHLEAVLEECERANVGHDITFFEITTAAAFLAFSRTPADIVLLENGLGGRLDATNVVARPALTGITPISLDHQQFLGDTIGLIAAEKAGIIKPGVVCVSGPQDPQAQTVLQSKADDVGAPLISHGANWSMQSSDAGFEVQLNGEVIALPKPNLIGPHQFSNAALAVVMARHLDGFKITDDHLRHGMTHADWPARLQRLHHGPVINALPDDCDVWLDGGHNPDAGQALSAHAAEAWSDRPLYLIAGMINTKDPVGYFKPLSQVAKSVHCVTIPNEVASVSAEDLAATARRAGLVAFSASSAADAASEIAKTITGPARVLVCGSLYFAGHILRTHE